MTSVSPVTRTSRMSRFLSREMTSRVGLTEALIAIFMAAVLIASGGCQASVKRQLYNARVSFNTGLATVNSVHNLGFVTPAEKQQLLPFVLAVRSALDAGDAEVKASDAAKAAGNLTQAQQLLENAKTYAKAALAGLQKFAEQEAIVRQRKAAATQPAKAGVI